MRNPPPSAWLALLSLLPKFGSQFNSATSVILRKFVRSETLENLEDQRGYAHSQTNVNNLYESRAAPTIPNFKQTRADLNLNVLTTNSPQHIKPISQTWNWQDSGLTISQNIDKLVERIINTQIDNEQFVNADITMKSITQIKKLFKKKLQSIHHVRVEY